MQMWLDYKFGSIARSVAEKFGRNFRVPDFCKIRLPNVKIVQKS